MCCTRCSTRGCGVAEPSVPLLEVDDLEVGFRTRAGIVRAVDHLSLTVGTQEMLGIVGESGSGKSVAMYSLIGLIRDPNVTISGRVRFEGRDLLGLPDEELRAIRGKQIAMVFQDPMTSLTPVYTVGWQIVEQIRTHEQVSKRCSARSASPTPAGGSTATRTSSRAACGSAS
jgi:peptide/nickel transport system ATP-binding protein